LGNDFEGLIVWPSLARDVWFGLDEKMARDEYDPLVRAAACRRRELSNRLRRDVYADDGEVARLKLEDVGTVVEGDGLAPVRVRVGAEPSLEFDRRLHRRQSRKRAGKTQGENRAYMV
jgi:hypothetical protein